jgi:mono/diheme cytochrome c family protein
MPDQQKSAEWNRGRYLVEGVAHCGACHTPKNIFGADRRGEAYGGGRVAGMFAPRLDAAERSGLKSWSVEDITEYLQSGRNARSHAGELMSEVVVNSTSVTTPRAPNKGSMPGYAAKMTDQEIADVTNYNRNAWGNAAPLVTPDRSQRRAANNRVPDAVQPGRREASQTPRGASGTLGNHRFQHYQVAILARNIRSRQPLSFRLTAGMLTEELIHGIPTQSERSLSHRPER